MHSEQPQRQPCAEGTHGPTAAQRSSARLGHMTCHSSLGLALAWRLVSVICKLFHETLSSYLLMAYGSWVQLWRLQGLLFTSMCNGDLSQ